MRWQIEITGVPDLLSQVNDDIQDSEFRIVNEGERFFLESPMFPVAASFTEIALLAVRIIDALNGVLRLRSNQNAIFSLVGGPLRVREDGTKEIFGIAKGLGLIGKPSGIGRVYDREGNLIEPPPQKNLEPVYLSMGMADQKIADLLRWWGRNEHSWFWLYKIFEVIRAECKKDCIKKKCNGEVIMAQRGWITEEESELFRRTACHPQAGGDDSRHGYSNEEPPTHPMALDYAQALIKNLLRNWLDHKAQQPV